MKDFKPNLIPNNSKDVDVLERILELVKKNGGISNYFITVKKDGCRLELLDGKCYSRELKSPQSILVHERFAKLAQLADKLGLILEGEFYAHGMKFNEIFRFFGNTDVTRESEIKKLTKLEQQGKLESTYPGRNVKWLTTFHTELRFWLFDGIVKDQLDLGYLDRMQVIMGRLAPHMNEIQDVFMSTAPIPLSDPKDLQPVFERAVEDGWEGLVLTHIDHLYKMGRTTLNQGTLLKLKDDAHEYDGIVLNIMEGTNVKEGTEKTKNELGRSVTSKKKGDRELSGMAKGLLVSYESGEFIVGLKDFDNEAKIELLKNKDQYIGRHFKYTGMRPTKDYPRSAYFKCWRDAKGEEDDKKSL